jgi:hypothetical protein
MSGMPVFLSGMPTAVSQLIDRASLCEHDVFIYKETMI